MKLNQLAAFTAAAAVAVASTSFAGVIMDFDATTWDGTGAWVSTVNNVQAVRGAGVPVKAVTTINGVNVDTINFDGASFDVNDVNHPLVGKKSFTISAVFANRGAGSGPNENEFYRMNGIVGKEIPNGGVGDWGLGITTGKNINGASGVSTGDVGSQTGPIVDNQYYTVSYVVAQTSATTFDQFLYLNGTPVASDLGLTYGNPGAIAASNFAIGALRDGADNPFFVGSLARLQFDDTALSAGQAQALASNYIGEAVPEPTSLGLLGLAGMGLLARRRKA